MVPITREKQGGALTSQNQRYPLDLFRREFDRLFDGFFGGWPTPFGQDFNERRVWDFGVTENDNEVTVRAELPGFEEKELNVQLNQNVLSIEAEKEDKDEGEEQYRHVYRSVTLPPILDSEKIQATYSNGVLELRIPKAEEAKPKRIAIQARKAGMTSDAPQQTSSADRRTPEAQTDDGKKTAHQTTKA